MIGREVDGMEGDLAYCEHDDWKVHDHSRIGFAHCPRCGQEVFIGPLLDRLLERMKEVERLRAHAKKQNWYPSE
jgi:ribosomal protein S27AE